MTASPSYQHIATLYKFCALSMHYPDSEWFTEEYRKSLFSLLDTLGADQEKKELMEAFNDCTDPLETLQIEHTRLFINGIPHVAAPPYGSVYLDKTLQGPHTEKTMRFYQDHGYTLKEGSDLPDHIVHQLEFLSLLAEQGNGTAESEFLRSIFLPWFSRFLARVKQEAKHPFYCVLVQLIDYLTKEENEHGIQIDEA